MKETITPDISNKEIKFKDILDILKNYKWSIIFITLLSFLLTYVYIYFKPSIYQSYSIIKVKANEKPQTDDVINSTVSNVGSKDVLEEISLLKTFRINKDSLSDVNFEVLFYKEQNYKKIEVYGKDVPIDIVNIEILNPQIIGKVLTLTPQKDGYSLTYQIPYKKKIKQIIFQKNDFSFNTMENNQFNKKIENQYVKLKINKKAHFSEPIHFKLFGDKRNIFENFIQSKLNIVQLEKDTSLIKISFEDTIPARANLYVDALTKSFIDYSIESKNTQNNKTLNFIIKELTNIKKDLKVSERKLELHQVSKNIVKPSDQAALYIRNLSDIEIEISENNLRQKLIKNLISFIKTNYKLDSIAPSVARLNDQNTLDLITKLQNMQIREEELSLDYTNEYPQLKTIRKQITTIRQQIEYNLKSLHQNIGYENTNLLQRKSSYENDMKKLPSKERELVNIKRNYEVKSKMYEYLLKKKAENNIIQLSTFSDYQIIDNAYNSNIPIKPKRSLILFLSIFMGLTIGTLLALLRHTRNRFIRDKQDLEKMTSLPIYGSIPYFKQKKHSISVTKDAKSPYTESFRTLRTNLQFINEKNTSTSILITSTIAGEGKSTSAANLAVILEMAKYKTVIVNFDLRKPTLHKFFSVHNDKGVSTYLSGRDTIDEIISPTEFANLDIISSGPIPADPAELVLSKELPQLFNELKKRYEYVIIDTAPIGIISDTKTLMQYSDLNLIIIREDYAKKEFITTLEDMIQKHNFKNIGLILNASKAKGGEYGYGYSYEYK